jgi:hypothetical protein
MRIAVLFVASGFAAYAIAAEAQTAGEAGSTSTTGGTTRVIIGGGLGGGFGARFKKNGQTVTFEDTFQGASDKTPLVAVNVATFGIALKPGFYVGLDLSGMAQAGKIAGISTAVQVTNYLAAVTWFPWETGLYLRGGAGLAGFVQTTNVNGSQTTERANGLGLLVGVGYALRLSGAHHLTLTAVQTWQSYGGSGATKPDSSQVGAVYLGYLYQN